MAVVQEKKNQNLKDDGLQTTQAICHPWYSTKATENEPRFLRDHQRPGRACQEARLFQTYGRIDAIVEGANRNDMHTPHSPEEPTTTYTCARS
jgi:hypothetical protein